MHQPIPMLDYSFNMLPWRRRIRVCLGHIDLDKLWDPAFALVDPGPVKDELDVELDQALWSPNQDTAYRSLQQTIATYMKGLRSGTNETTRHRNHIKLLLLQMAMDTALAGVQHRYRIPQWKLYLLEVIRTKGNRRDGVFFTADSTCATDHDQAFDWVLQALMSQEDEILDEFKWSVSGLYKCPYNNPNKRIDITQEFWDRVGPLAVNPMSLF